jgi:inosose dehydratase
MTEPVAMTPTGASRQTAIVVANAPISYGAFELTVGIDPNVPAAVPLLDEVAEAGYAGIDLGPAGYLGRGDNLRERLQARGLGLAGGYLELPYTDRRKLAEAMADLDDLLDVFDAVPDSVPAPKPTLADAGSPIRRANPGRSATDSSFGWSNSDWRRFADGFARVAEHCRERGYEPTFHHETGTHVEAAWEIEQMLEVTDVGLCLDTGHLLMGGGDPVTAVSDWGERLNHFHLKDAHREVLEKIITDGAPADAIWRRRAFCTLGQGDVAVEDTLGALRDTGYAGWLVVEQDIMPDPADPPGWAAGEQVANRAYLRALGF